jgi:hypothetical protein
LKKAQASSVKINISHAVDEKDSQQTQAYLQSKRTVNSDALQIVLVKIAFLFKRGDDLSSVTIL